MTWLWFAAGLVFGGGIYLAIVWLAGKILSINWTDDR